MKKIFHGNLKPKNFASALIAEFNHGNLQAQQLVSCNQIIVQITTRNVRQSGGHTAVTVTLEETPDGVAIDVGRQSWFGLAASLGSTALLALRNPLTLLGRLDDVAQDIESLQITDRIWEMVESVAYAAGATFELSERLRRLICEHCDTANPIGEPRCIACGAPLGYVQPKTCINCGYVINNDEIICPNCKSTI